MTEYVNALNVKNHADQHPHVHAKHVAHACDHAECDCAEVTACDCDACDCASSSPAHTSKHESEEGKACGHDKGGKMMTSATMTKLLQDAMSKQKVALAEVKQINTVEQAMK